MLELTRRPGSGAVRGQVKCRRAARRPAPLVLSIGLAAACLMWALPYWGGAMQVGAQAAQDWRWGVPERVNDDPLGSSQRAPRLQASADGALHAIWLDDRLGAGAAMYYARKPAGAPSWLANERIDPAQPDAALADPAMAIDGQGAVHLVWAEVLPGQVRLMHRRRAPEGGWGEAVIVDEAQSTRLSASPAVICDPWGTTHVLWEQAGRQGGVDLAYRARVYDGTWIDASRMLENTFGAQRAPALSITGAGEIVAVWEDTRDGLSQVYASRLPPGSRYWWPEKRLSVSGGPAIHRDPRVAAAADGTVTAVWIEETGRGRLRSASALAPFESWTVDRVRYQPRLGSLLEVDVVGGRAGRRSLLWTESRDSAEGARLYAAELTAEPGLRPSRVDASRLAAEASSGRAAIDRDGHLHALWQARYREDPADVLHASVSLGLPPAEPAEIFGRLLYQGRRFGCVSDGFLVQPCDGSAPTIVRSAGVDLVPYLGRFVRLGGVRVDEAPCPRFLASEVAFKPSDCPSGDASVTGTITRDGLPAEGVRVAIGGQSAFTGPSGRYYFDHVVPTTFTISATMPCALEAALPEARLLTGLNRIEPLELTMGDVVQDCGIDLRDLIRVAGQYKRTSATGITPACADLDRDGRISIFDVTRVSARIGMACPAAWRGVDGEAVLGEPGRPAMEGASAASAPRVGEADSSGPNARIRLELRPVLEAAERHADEPSVAAGWSLVLAWPEVKSPPIDLDPRAKGIQPFALAGSEAGIFEIENRFDGVSGQLRYAASRMGSFPTTQGREALVLELGWDPDSNGAWSPPALVEIEISDSRGGSLEADLVQAPAAVAPSRRGVGHLR